MNLFGFTISRDRPVAPVRVEYGRRLSEREVREALNVPLEHPVLRACLQLLDTTEQETQVNAAEDLHLGTDVTAAHIGGGRYLRDLRARLLDYVPEAKAKGIGAV